jgi:hydroxymethylglutaryl-CoA lyase
MRRDTDTQTSIAAMPDGICIADDVGGFIQLCIAIAFVCPFDGLTLFSK